MHDALNGFVKRLMAGYEVRDKVDKEQLPRGQRRVLLYNHRYGQQHNRDDNQDNLTAQAVLMFVLVFVLMMMFVCVCHYFISCRFLSACKGRHFFLQLGCKVQLLLA